MSKLVPKLRFKEFSGEWEEKKLGDIVDIFKGKGISKNDISENGKLDCIRYGELYTEYREIINNIKSKTNLNQNNLVLSKKNDVIIPSSGETNIDIATAHCILKDNIALGGDLNILRGQENGIFLAYYLSNAKKNEISKLAQGIAVVHLYSSQLSKLTLHLPTPKEQQKIANTLSSLDSLIEAYQRKVEALYKHKKALMQQLFPSEGENVPKLRFKEFTGEWEEKKLGDIYKFFPTNSFSRDKLNYEKGKVKNIHYGDIHTKFSTLFDITKEVVPYINQSVDITKIKKDYYCVEGDMVFADASEDLDDIGKSIELINLNNESLLAGLHTLLARQREEKLIKGFSGHLFKSNFIRNQIKREAQGAKVLGISVRRLENIMISFPKSPKEQQKIANTLSSLDSLIEATKQKVEALYKHKKALMQQMFVSGEG